MLHSQVGRECLCGTGDVAACSQPTRDRRQLDPPINSKRHRLKQKRELEGTFLCLKCVCRFPDCELPLVSASLVAFKNVCSLQ